MLKLTVSQDGSGDFASISEAVLAVPYELEAEICIGPGIYREKLVCEKRALTLRGAGADATTLIFGDGGKVEANTEANRLQIFFEDKPDEATREALKSNGFRWSPKAGVWQRQLTSNAYYAADYVKAIAPLTGEKPTELQRAHIRAQKVAAQEQFAQGQPEQEAPQDKDTFSIYQIKGGDAGNTLFVPLPHRLDDLGCAVAE